MDMVTMSRGQMFGLVEMGRVEEAYENTSRLRDMGDQDDVRAILEIALDRFLALRSKFEQKYPSIAVAFKDSPWMKDGEIPLAQNPCCG